MADGLLTRPNLERIFTWGARDPLRWYRPTVPALAMLQDPSDIVLLRGPNQVGKSTALAADLLDLMLGLGTWDADRPKRYRVPVQVWVVSPDTSASLVIQQRINTMLPSWAKRPETTFSDRGFGNAVLRLVNGSVCTFKTHNQKLESATLHAVFIDEPPMESSWDALLARVNHLRGCIRIYLCPQDGGGRFLRAKVEAGDVSEHHYTLTVRNCWPKGAFRPFKAQDQIDHFARNLRRSQIPQRVFGEWDGPPEDSYFPDFDKAVHVVNARPTGKGWRLAIGVDYGPSIGKPAAALVAVRDGDHVEPTVVFLDEERCPPDMRWGNADIAAAIKRILDRQRLHPRDIDAWMGDRPAQSRQGSRQSNARTWAHLIDLYKLQSSHCPFRIPMKRQGIVRHTCDLLNDLFVRGHCTIMASCVHLIEFFELFDGDEHHRTKDIGDAGRYAMMGLVKPRWYGGAPSNTPERK